MSTENVLNHHLDAFLNTDVTELMKDYTAESALYTPNGEIKGIDGIRGFFEYAFSILPKDSLKFNTAQKIIFGNYVYLAWNCSSALVDIPLGTDTFKIENGKIAWQTLAAHIVQK